MQRTYPIATILTTFVLVAGAAFSTGCESEAQTDALIGSAIGAAIGAGVDHNNRGRGAAIGAAAGGGAGYIYGNEQDKKKSTSY